jgi:hypothetical protein
MPEPNRRGNPGWIKGQSGNPNGAPKKESSWAKIIKRVGEEKDPELKIENKEVVAKALYKEAKSGNVQAIRLITELEEGFGTQAKMQVSFNWIGDSSGNCNGPI